jgi:hypothetical protein
MGAIFSADTARTISALDNMATAANLSAETKDVANLCPELWAALRESGTAVRQVRLLLNGLVTDSEGSLHDRITIVRDMLDEVPGTMSLIQNAWSSNVCASYKLSEQLDTSLDVAKKLVAVSLATCGADLTTATS